MNKATRMSITLTPTLKKWIDTKAATLGLSTAAFIRFTLHSAKVRSDKQGGV